MKTSALLLVVGVITSACELHSDVSRDRSLASVVVLTEDFDGPLSDWTQSLCITRKSTQHCSLEQRVGSQAGPPLSAPYFGSPQIRDLGGGCAGSIEVRYARDFVVSANDTYDLEAYVGTKRCFGCNIRSRMFVDGSMIIERIGPNGSQGDVSNTLEQRSIALTAGAHTIEIGMYSNFACNGTFGTYFDSIVLTRPDSDGDGVSDADDLCPDTAGADPDAGVPNDHLGVNRWADLDGDGNFDTTPPPGNGPDDSYTMIDTRGCNCAQIIEELGLGAGHTKFGCSNGAMKDWVELASQ